MEIGSLRWFFKMKANLIRLLRISFISNPGLARNSIDMSAFFTIDIVNDWIITFKNNIDNTLILIFV